MHGPYMDHMDQLHLLGLSRVATNCNWLQQQQQWGLGMGVGEPGPSSTYPNLCLALPCSPLSLSSLGAASGGNTKQCHSPSLISLHSPPYGSSATSYSHSFKFIFIHSTLIVWQTTVCCGPTSSDIRTVIIFQCCNCFIDFNGLSYDG